jgi:iron uptake system EfeUOB component EfeO/EfeM
MADYNKQFINACKNGQIEKAKRLVQDHHVYNISAFIFACVNGHLEIAKWLVQDH